MKKTIGQKLARKFKAGMNNFDECGNEYPKEQWKVRISCTFMLDHADMLKAADASKSCLGLEEIIAWKIDQMLGSKRKIGEPSKKKETLLTTGNLFPH